MARILRRKDEEPYRAADQHTDAVHDDGGEQRAQAWLLVDPSAYGGGEEQHADGLGDAVDGGGEQRAGKSALDEEDDGELEGAGVEHGEEVGGVETSGVLGRELIFYAWGLVVRLGRTVKRDALVVEVVERVVIGDVAIRSRGH